VIAKNSTMPLSLEKKKGRTMSGLLFHPNKKRGILGLMPVS